MDGRELEVREFEIGRLNTAYTLSDAAASETIPTWDIRKALLVSTSDNDYASPGLGFVGGAVIGGVLAATLDDTTRATSSRFNQVAYLIAGGAVVGGVAGWFVGHYVDEEVTSTYTVELNSCGLLK
jgi:outer membrane lipoprotein SlyB